MSFLIMSTSLTLKDSDLPKYGVFIDFCDLQLQRSLQEWTAMKWLEIDWQFVNRNCQAFVHLLSIGSNFLLLIQLVISSPNGATEFFLCILKSKIASGDHVFCFFTQLFFVLTDIGVGYNCDVRRMYMHVMLLLFNISWDGSLRDVYCCMK